MIKSCVDAATKKEWEKQLIQLQDLLQHNGDNKHNVSVIAQKEEEILLQRDTELHYSITALAQNATCGYI